MEERFPALTLPQVDPNIQFLIGEIRKTYESQIEELKIRIKELESKIRTPVPHIKLEGQKPTVRTTSEAIRMLEDISFKRAFPVTVDENAK